MRSLHPLAPCSRCRQLVRVAWLPQGLATVNEDGSEHWQGCDRSHLFGQSPLKCKNCESPLERSAGEWYCDRSTSEYRWFPAKSYRLLTCSGCSWFYQWDAQEQALEFSEIEQILSRLEFADWLQAKSGVLNLV